MCVINLKTVTYIKFLEIFSYISSKELYIFSCHVCDWNLVYVKIKVGLKIDFYFQEIQ